MVTESLRHSNHLLKVQKAYFRQNFSRLYTRGTIKPLTLNHVVTLGESLSILISHRYYFMTLNMHFSLRPRVDNPFGDEIWVVTESNRQLLSFSSIVVNLRRITSISYYFKDYNMIVCMYIYLGQRADNALETNFK